MEQVPVELPGTNSFLSAVSSLLEIGFIQPPRLSLSSKGQVSAAANQGKEGMQNKREAVRKQ